LKRIYYGTKFFRRNPRIKKVVKVLSKENMILAVDVQYLENSAKVAGVVFKNWADEESQQEYVSKIDGVADYESGNFFKRELPCIIKLITEHLLMPECIVVDGYVFLDGYFTAGLGKHLYDMLDGKVAVVGIAKKQFKGIDSNFEVYRGDSRTPLYVTAVGIDIEQAKLNILKMHGAYRLPTLIKRVDQICRA
jgi:deoxyribonuclease V